MTITDLKKERKSLYSIFIDYEYAFKLDSNVVFERALKIGQDVDDEFLHKLLLESQERRAKERALWYLSNRDYSKKEIFKKLLSEASPEIVEKTLDRLEELGLINDYRFAEKLAKDLFNLKGLSARAVKYKLIEKGIDKELADEISKDLSPDPTSQILKLLDTKYRNKINDEKGRRQTIAGLQRLGYSWADIKSALYTFDNEYYDWNE